MTISMTRLVSAICVAALLELGAVQPTIAETLSPALQADGVIKVKSAYPLDETIARIKQDIAAKGSSTRSIKPSSAATQESKCAHRRF